jgi:hypothetical protein
MRFGADQTQSDPEGGIPSGSLEALGRFETEVSVCWRSMIKAVAEKFFRLIASFVSFVSSPVRLWSSIGNLAF